MLKRYLQVLNITLASFLCIAVIGIATSPVTVGAAPIDDVCAGVGLTGANCDPAWPTGDKVPSLVKNVISIMSYAIGIAAVIMIIVGGFKYVFSNGDANSLSSAKNTILYALVGLVVAMFAQLIVRFVIDRV